MAAQTQDEIRTTRGLPSGEEIFTINTSSTVYRGSLIGLLEADGRAIAAAAATNQRFAGIAVDLISDGAATGTGVGVAGGTEKVQVQWGHEVLMNVATAIRTTTSLGLDVFVADDQTVGGTAVGTAATRNVVGELVAFEAADKSTAWVRLRVRGPNGSIAV